jgi:hypothetical protein
LIKLKELLNKTHLLEKFSIDCNDWKKMGDSDLKLLFEAISPLSNLKEVSI